MSQDKKQIDWERIRLLAEANLQQRRTWKESDILSLFRILVAANKTQEAHPELPMDQNDTIVYEMSFKYGRADIVIFHINGSASVIEVKDGTKGYNHVVSGLGQVGLYASQLAMNKGVIGNINKCLLWTSTGDLMLDTIICRMCEEANTIPLPWADLHTHMSVNLAVNQYYQENPHGTL